MSANGTLLCIHRDPAQLSHLQEHGYELATATSGSEAIRLFKSRPVDAVVIEYHSGLLDGAAIADELRKARPEVPIVLLSDHIELPASALKCVDALVIKSDGPHFLLATVHFILTVKPLQRDQARVRPQRPAHLRRSGSPQRRAGNGQGEEKDAPFSPKVWDSIRKGTIRF